VDAIPFLGCAHQLEIQAKSSQAFFDLRDGRGSFAVTGCGIGDDLIFWHVFISFPIIIELFIFLYNKFR
jgi:hypothetical protein